MGPTKGLTASRVPWPWILAIAGALLYIPFIGGVSLFDWDEINFAEISREMMTTGDYLNTQINYHPFFEKPPFFFWLQVGCMKIFGVGEFAARLPNALAGIIVSLLIFRLGTHWVNKRFAIFWAVSYMGSILPALYHKSGIIDPWFNLFIFSSIAAWVEGTSRKEKSIKWLLISGILSGMAVLTKGPVGPLLVGLTVLVMRLISKNKSFMPLRGIVLFILGNIIIAGLWFGINWAANGPDFILAFLKYQAELLTESVAGHKGFPGYHFAVTLFGVFPASVLALGALRKRVADETDQLYSLRLLMIIIMTIVLVLFSVVQSKIVHYSSMAYYPVSFLSAWVITRYLDGRFEWKAWQLTLSFFVAAVVLFAVTALPFVGQHIDWLKSSVTMDAFSRAAMEAKVQWGFQDYLPALWLTLLCMASAWLWKQKKSELAFITLFTGMAIFVNLALIFFIGKIERYSQHAAVEFCESYSGQKVNIKTIGFKSYLPYFYAKKPAPDTLVDESPMEQYYILRVDKRKKLEELPDLEILYEKNGYIFLREP